MDFTTSPFSPRHQHFFFPPMYISHNIEYHRGDVVLFVDGSRLFFGIIAGVQASYNIDANGNETKSVMYHLDYFPWSSWTEDTPDSDCKAVRFGYAISEDRIVDRIVQSTYGWVNQSLIARISPRLHDALMRHWLEDSNEKNPPVESPDVEFIPSPEQPTT